VKKHKQILAIVALLLSLKCASQDAYSKHNSRVKHRLCAGYVFSFYKNHPQHTANTKSKPGFNAAYKADILLVHKTFLTTGLEFMSQGFKFYGYYKAPQHTYLFDEQFVYLHEVRYNEMQLPLGFKQALNNEKEHFYTAYYFGGIGFRYIIKSETYIENDSTGFPVYEGKTDLIFEHHVIDKKLNAFYHLGFGFQKNFRTTARALFFEMTYKYNISRLHYVGNATTNALNIRDGNLAITIGIKF